MSIAVLNQVYDETRRLAIAGSALAVGDFRLKKLIEPLRKSGQKAPVFAKVADSIELLVDGKEKSSPAALLDLCSLVLAILYTQGETGAQGKAKPIKPIEIGIATTQVSSRLLKPLLEALTTTGSGRMETVEEAFERGAFNDLRLVNPALNALDDVYPELADFMALKVLPQYGPAIVPQVKDRIKLKGKSPDARRLWLLHELDPATARPLVEAAFENGSKEMKLAGLRCLGDAKEDLPLLIDQASAKSKEVREVVYDRLARFKGKEVDAVFEKATSGADLEMLVDPISKTKNTKLVTQVQKQARTAFEELTTTKAKKTRDKLAHRFELLLQCLYGRKEKSTTDLLLGLYDQREALIKTIGGDALLETLCSVMVSTGDKKLLATVAQLHSELDGKPSNTFLSSVVATLATESPKKAYDTLHHYYDTPKRSRSNTGMFDLFSILLSGQWREYGYQDYHPGYGRNSRTDLLKGLKLDPRWTDLAVKQKDVAALCQLANAKHKAATQFLVDYIENPGKKGEVWESMHALSAIVDMKHPRATELVLASFKKAAKQKAAHYSISYWLFPLVSKLPKTAVTQIEKEIIELPETYIDQIMPHLVTLKQKSK